MILGSGLGAFADAVEDSVEVSYAEIPGWPVSTAVGDAAGWSSAGSAASRSR